MPALPRDRGPTRRSCAPGVSSSLPVPWAVRGLHLCEAAVHRQFRSRDVAAVVGCEKHHGLGDLIGRAEPAERSGACNHLPELPARFRGRHHAFQTGRVDGARAHCVHANAAILQVRCQCPRERAHGGLCGAVDAVCRRPFAGADGRVQDDRGAVRQQRQRLLHREKHALHVDVEDPVVQLLGDRAQGRKHRDAGIGEDNVEPALLPLDLCEEAIEVAEVRHVSLDAGHIASDLLDRRRRLRLAAPGDEDVGAFLHEPLRRRETDAAVATRDECDFSFKLAHVFLLGCQAKALRCLVMNSSSVVGWRPPIFLTTSFVPAKTPFWWSMATSRRCCMAKESPARRSGACSNSPYNARALCPAGGFCPPEAIIWSMVSMLTCLYWTSFPSTRLRTLAIPW